MFVKKRARKKKGLTDPVELIPFSGQSLRTQASSIQQKAVPQNHRYTSAGKPEPKTVVTPTGNLQTQHVSIKQILTHSREKQEQGPADYSNRPATHFQLDQVKMVWKQFAFKMKENGMETIYHALSKRDPILKEGHLIHQEFDNQIQIDIIHSHLSDMLEFVREKLNNWTVNIQFSVADQENESKKLLTGKDKFNELAKKNSNLYSLQKTFNLDIDY